MREATGLRRAVSSTGRQDTQGGGRSRAAIRRAVEILEARRLLSADLQFTGDVVIDPSTAHPGDTLHVNFGVKNAGDAEAPASVTKIQIYKGDSLVLTTSVAEGSFAIGASRSESDAISLSSTLATGTYTARVQLDSTTSAHQGANTTDDLHYRTFTVTATATVLPNLVAGHVVPASLTAHPGGSISVSWAINNAGGDETAITSTDVRLGSSATTVPGRSLTLLTKDTPALPGSTSVAQDGSVTIPTNTAAGTYYIWVVADASDPGKVTESSETDNAARSDAIIITVAEVAKPNLAPSAVTPSVTTAHPGDTVSLTWHMTNSGTADATATTTDVRLSTSESTVPGRSLTLLSKPTAGIAAQAGIDQDGTVTIPPNTAARTYFLWVVADASDPATLSETTTSDNAAHSAGIAVTIVVTAKPNLMPAAVTTGTTSVHAGDTVAIAWRTYNTGDGDAAATTTDVRLGASESDVPGRSATLLSKDTPAIAAKSAVNQDGTVTIPTGTAPGTYFLWVVADASDPAVLSEVTTSDNAAHSRAITITVVDSGHPNLAPTNVKASPTSVNAGNTVTVTWVMKNGGSAAAAATTTSIRLGTSETAYPGDGDALANVATGEIAAGASLSQHATISIPSTLAAGRYFVWIGADAAGVLTQTTTADDHAHSPGLTVKGAAVAMHLAFDGTLPNGVAGQKRGPVTVLIEGPDNAVIATASQKVTLAATTFPGGGKLLGTTTVPARNGRAVFSNVFVKVAGTYALGAASTGATGATSNSFLVSPAAASSIVFSHLPGDGHASDPQSITAQLFDKFGNLATGATGTAVLSLGARPDGATLVGNASVAVSGGIATFSNLIFSAPGKYTVIVTIDGVGKAASRKFALR